MSHPESLDIERTESPDIELSFGDSAHLCYQSSITAFFVHDV